MKKKANFFTVSVFLTVSCLEISHTIFPYFLLDIEIQRQHTQKSIIFSTPPKNSDLHKM